MQNMVNSGFHTGLFVGGREEIISFVTQCASVVPLGGSGGMLPQEIFWSSEIASRAPEDW